MLPTDSHAPPPEGPFEGSSCLAGPNGYWRRAYIRRVNEDGSFKIEFAIRESPIQPFWYGVTLDELSFDDARQWPAVFARIRPDGQAMGRSELKQASKILGYELSVEEAEQAWDAACEKIFRASPERAKELRLDEAQSYQSFLHLGISAKLCAARLAPDPPKPFFKLYWNQLRMGGREPGELPQPVTLEDALAAMGLTDRGWDSSTGRLIERFERENGIQFPTVLKELLQRNGVSKAVKACHPNNPELLPLSEWTLRRGMKEKKLSGECALTIMMPHQGDHEWAVVFDDHQPDGQVYIKWGEGEEETWLLTAPSVGLFFWDLAQTGLGWDQDTRFRGGHQTGRSDIGQTFQSPPSLLSTFLKWLRG
jgi:hypothetical protein